MLNKNTSQYFDINEFLIEKFESLTSFGILHMNIASLTKHHEELFTLLKLFQYEFKVIGISGTRLTSG